MLKLIKSSKKATARVEGGKWCCSVLWGFFLFAAPEEWKLPFPLRLQKEQVVNQLCVISNCCSLFDPRRSTVKHVYKWTDINRQIDRLTARHKKLDQTHTGGSKDSPTGTAELLNEQEKHKGCLSVDSAHLPALKHFNHLTANYSGARQSRTETHTSLPQHSQMALQAGSPLSVFTLPVYSASTTSFWYKWKSNEI